MYKIMGERNSAPPFFVVKGVYRTDAPGLRLHQQLQLQIILDLLQGPAHQPGQNGCHKENQSNYQTMGAILIVKITPIADIVHSAAQNEADQCQPKTNPSKDLQSFHDKQTFLSDITLPL